MWISLPATLALAEAVGAELALNYYDQEPYRYSMEHHALRDGDALYFGKLHLVALHTPGHTPEHLSFVLYDEERNASQPLALFSGDFLFVGSLGRPDLLGVKPQLHLLTNSTTVCINASLHFPMASSSIRVTARARSAVRAWGNAESTLGYERLSQILFKLDEDPFVREIVASVPPMPSYYPRMKELNSKGASSVADLPGNTSLTPARVAALLTDESVTVIDLRRPEAFGGAHIPGALNIGAGQNLSLWAEWMLDPEQRFVLVSDKGDDEASRRALVWVGLRTHKGLCAERDACLD